MRIYAKTVPIIFTIGTIIMTFGATAFLHFAYKNNETYYYLSDYFKVQSTKKLLH